MEKNNRILIIVGLLFLFIIIMGILGRPAQLKDVPDYRYVLEKDPNTNKTTLILKDPNLVPYKDKLKQILNVEFDQIDDSQFKGSNKEITDSIIPPQGIKFKNGNGSD